MEELNIEEMTALRGGRKPHRIRDRIENGIIEQENSHTQHPAGTTVIQINNAEFDGTQPPAGTVIRQTNIVEFE